MIDPREIEQAIRRVTDQTTFVRELLIDVLGWPIDKRAEVIEDIAYEWTEKELHTAGLSKEVVGSKAFQIVLPGNPWGIFIFEFRHPDVFATGRGMTGVLRKVLQGVALKKRGSRDPKLAAFNRENLLFICSHNYESYRFAHFKAPHNDSATPPMASFGWGPDDLSAVRTICEFNLGALQWPDEQPGSDDGWIKAWSGAFDVEKVTKRFYQDYATVFTQVEKVIAKQKTLKGDDLRLFTQSLFNRLMFLRFIERKGWLKLRGQRGTSYLAALGSAGGIGRKSLYQSRLQPLFFEGLAEDGKQSTDAYGSVPLLNGGLFEQSGLDRKVTDLPDEIFPPVIGPDGLFYRYNFTVEESTPLDIDVAVDPEMLGKVFEELVTGRHGSGSYYTPRPVVAFMSRETLKGYLTHRTKAPEKAIARLVEDHVVEGLTEAHAHEITIALDDLKAVDPACGSGAYLLGLLQEVIALRRALQSEKLAADPQFLYDLKLHMIRRSLYGVDIDPFATGIAKLRLWLSLAVEADHPMPLPNLDFKIETGDSLLAPDPRGVPDLVRATLQSASDRLLRLKIDYLDARGAEKQCLKQEIDRRESELGSAMHMDMGHGEIEWRIQFAEVFAYNGGFNIVLANPPYVNMVQMDARDPVYRDTLRKRYTTATGGFDLFVPFMERGLQLLAPDGEMAYITPNKLLSAEYAADLRSFIRRHAVIRSLTDLSHVPVFNASVYPVVTMVKRASDHENGPIAVFVADAASLDRVVVKRSHTAPASALDSDQNRWSVLLEENAAELMPALGSGTRLQAIAEVSGAATVSEAYEWKDAVCDHGEQRYASDPDRYRPFIVSGNVRPFAHTWRSRTVRYIKHGYTRPVLDTSHGVVSKRRGRQVKMRKIIVSGMAKRPTCVWDEEGIAAGKSTVLVFPKDDSDGPFIAALINSSIMAKLYRTMFGSLSLAGGYMRFGPPQIRALPLPDASHGEKQHLAHLVLRIQRSLDPSDSDLKAVDEYVEGLFLRDAGRGSGATHAE